MFIDASVLVAILGYEEDGDALQTRLASAEHPIFVSPVVRFEATLALARAGLMRRASSAKVDPRAVLAEAKDLVDEYLHEIGASEIAISTQVGDGAIEAAMIYGKAVGHRAKLNFGDCFSYACAKSQNVPLLYKGNDFSQTDLA